ncbi:MAG TPA: hypothetical protein VK795_07310 [Terriglobales bacterium]|jgi:hypothetical protein|nr:hypothetical protein [Terriglobales bacterium]
MSPLDSPAEKLIVLGVELAIFAIWVWMAVWTMRGLRVITRNTVPFPKRTIWLTKILAVIVGAGGVIGALSELGLPWYIAILPAGALVFIAFREKVEDIVVSTPPQNEAAYRASWEEYKRLRTVFSWSWIVLGAAFITALLATVFRSSMSASAAKIIFIVLAVIFVAALPGIYYSQWKLLRWACPRCGKSFRGFWGSPWLPKRCRYCGLPRWEEHPQQN